MKCPNCKAKIVKHHIFCSVCGTKIEKKRNIGIRVIISIIFLLCIVAVAGIVGNKLAEKFIQEHMDTTEQVEETSKIMDITSKMSEETMEEVEDVGESNDKNTKPVGETKLDKLVKKKNLLTQLNQYSKDGTLYNRFDFEYNENDQLSVVRSSIDPSYDKAWTYYYDDSGHLIKIDFRENGNAFTLEEYHYNQKGQLESSFYSDVDYDTEYTYFYNSQGVLEKTVGRNEGQIITIEYEYNSDGLVEREYRTTSYGNNGNNQLIITSFEYDEMGRILSVASDYGNSTYKVSYRYDLEPFCISTYDGTYSLLLMDDDQRTLWDMQIGESELIIDEKGRLSEIQTNYENYEFCYDKYE